MHSNLSRRKFLSQIGGAALALPFLSCAASAHAAAVPAGLQIGYSSITWNGNDAQAIQDIASLGFKGIQLRSNVLDKYGANPAELKKLLVQNKLTLAMFSGG